MTTSQSTCRLATRRLAFALAVALSLAAAGAQAQSGARVLRVFGSVEIGTGQPPVWRPARAGEVLPPGASIRAGDGARAAVRLGSGVARVYENSLLRIPEPRAASALRLWLEHGAAIFDVDLPRGGRFEVETPEAVAAVKGTRFHVSAERGLTSLGVYEGVVEVRSADADPMEEPLLLREGFGARSDRDTLELMVLEELDPWSAWEAGAPPPDLATGPVPAAPDFELEERGDVKPGPSAERDPGPIVDRDFLAIEGDAFERDDDQFDRDGEGFEGDGEGFEGDDEGFECDDAQFEDANDEFEHEQLERANERYEDDWHEDTSGPGGTNSGSGSNRK